MTRTQALERINEVVGEMDQLEREKKAVLEDFKLRRQQLKADLAMCRADVDQMTLAEVSQ